MFDILGKRREDLIEMGIKPKKKSFYEKTCNTLEKSLPLPIPVFNEEKLQESIDFSHLVITPRGSTLFSFFFILSASILAIILAAVNIISIPLTILLIFGIIGLGYYFLNYPLYYATQYKIKATSEMVLAIVYMTVSMKVKSNLENAVIFTASNLKGPLRTDLSELVWDVFNGKYYSFEQAMDHFIKKWKLENQEFTQAVNLIKTSIYQGPSEREMALQEAVRIILDGTKERMKGYSRELKSSLTVLNALGILLPIIGLMFFPMVTVFMPDAVKPTAIAIGYDIVLPLIVFFLMRSFLKKRPATFHQPEVFTEQKTGIKKLLGIDIIVPVLLTITLVGIGLYNILVTTEQFSLKMLLFSLLIIVGISLGISVHCLMSTSSKLKRKNEIIEMENELHMVLYQIGYQLRSGGSIENNIMKTKSKIQELKISKLFEVIISNIQMFGVTFQQAIFNLKNGAIYNYPSYLISAIFKAISEISSSGSKVLSESIISISNYLKNMKEIENYLEDMLSDVTSTMKIQSLILAPVASGIVVALAAMMMNMIVNLSEWVVSFQDQLGSYGSIGSVGSGIFDSILTIDKILPVSYFQLIVGIYMLEVVLMITLFLSIIKYGDEKIQRKNDIGKAVLTAITIYSLTIIILYLLLTSIITLTWIS